MDCTSCKKRLKCKKLCPSALLYVNQDDNPEAWRHITFKEDITASNGKMPDAVSTTEAILQNYFIDRKEVKEIAESYCKSRQYIHYVIQKHKKRMAEIIKKEVENSHRVSLMSSRKANHR